jgi:penicillin amidase
MSGCWANAEPVNKGFTEKFSIKGVSKDATVWFDERLVPHIHASNEHDLYFLQGYIHAYFRLWQMDMQTRAAGGRVSEVVGTKALDFDRKQRRKGMVYAAENALKAIAADPRSKGAMEAYTDGINAYIAKLSYKHYPLEYKLMGFHPEKWSLLRSALLMKYMADDLTGKTDDIAFTYLRDVMPKEEFNRLFPEKIPSSASVIPGGTHFDTPSLRIPVAPPDSLAFPRFKTTDFGDLPEEGKGSNNWALSGSRTASGAPILCNDPHLGLYLPSIWFEMQLQAPGVNVYGASLPGAPGVVIGFNDSIAWGCTNNYRDVKDFYLIKPVEGNKNNYWFAGKQLPFKKRIERIGIKGKRDLIDTVYYTIHGPVMYDEHFHDKAGMNKPLAVSWMAHRPSNDLLAIYQLNRARNYESFVKAIHYFFCPAQNMLYADRAGNIALWGQGQFINKWPGQGRFVMNGADSSTLWKELIPMRENPHAINPPQGYLASANQNVTDASYPYWYDGDFVELRAWRINEVLAKTQKATIQDMFALQNDNHSFLAEKVVPVMLKYTRNISDGPIQKLRQWDYNLTAESETGAFFQIWWYRLYIDAWVNKFGTMPNPVFPLTERTMQLLTDTTKNNYFKNLPELVASTYQKAVDSFNNFQKTSKGAEWYKVKNTSVTHLTKLPAFSYPQIKAGGWGNTVNAMKGDHGPSWRMVVQMGNEIEAYGIYPGGQSGNPGSKYYANFLQNWADGKYYRLQFLPNTEQQNNKSIKYTWAVHP